MKCRHRLFVFLLLFLGGCASARVEDYAQHKPGLDIRDYFNGEIEAAGVFIDRSNMADPSFHADMNGAWKGNEGIFKERFTYSDGRVQDRLWKIHVIDDHRFTATANDVIGVAEGAQYGNAMNMKYMLAVTTKEGKTYNLSIDDWNYLLDGHTVINHIIMNKFGLKVGELIIEFHKK